jgi:predicted glycoside hydrolase/deacetylase ChbG (UPF0249 family)
MLIIVNADDLGASEPINKEVFDLMESGLVTSATIMSNAPAFAHAAERTRDFPNCSFGVHLNLSAFRPMSYSPGLDPVLDEIGNLSRKVFEVPITAGMQAAFLQEWTAQVQHVYDAGVPISHFDSHHHAHTIPKLFPVLKALQRRFGIRKVRSTINLLPPEERMSSLRSLKKALFRFALHHYYPTKSPDGFATFDDFAAALKSGRLPKFQFLELMVHPGTTNPRYIEEIALLRSGWQTSLPPRFRLGSYHSL